MFKCEICGREIFKKNRIGEYTVCSKHMHQWQKYHKFLDSNPRTQNDLNDFRFINEKTVQFDVYYQDSTYCDSFLIDSEDLEKVRYKKWRKDRNNHIVTGNRTTNNPRRELSRLIMNLTEKDLEVVDYINGNTLDNRKNNLRICLQSENLRNKHFMNNNKSGFIGVYFNKGKQKYVAEIRNNGIKCYLGAFKLIEKAVYSRYIAEILVFKEYRTTNNDENIKKMITSLSEIEQKELYDKVIIKLKNKNMIIS